MMIGLVTVPLIVQVDVAPSVYVPASTLYRVPAVAPPPALNAVFMVANVIALPAVEPSADPLPATETYFSVIAIDQKPSAICVRSCSFVVIVPSVSC